MNQSARRFGRGFACGMVAGVVATSAILGISAFTGFTNPIFVAATHFHRATSTSSWQLFLAVIILNVAVAGIVGALLTLADRNKRKLIGSAIVVIPVILIALLHSRAMGTNLRGWPSEAARLATLLAIFVTLLLFERTLSLLLGNIKSGSRPANSYTPSVTRRALILGAIGIVAAGGLTALLRKLYRSAASSYDGLEYKGELVKPITPARDFYCVTGNFIDPRVSSGLWHLEVDGLVQSPRTWRIQDLRGMPRTDQETTLISSRNPIGGGLISNALWTGVALRELLTVASPLAGAGAVRFDSVDGDSETFSLEAAMEPDVLLAHEMNGERLPDRQGHPLRLIIPGTYGERSLKWLSRVEVIAETRMPDVGLPRVPTFARIDFPQSGATLRNGEGIAIKGVAFASGREILRVDISSDGGGNWTTANIDYAASPSAWVLWHSDWQPNTAGPCALTVRVTDREAGDEQTRACHTINARVTS